MAYRNVVYSLADMAATSMTDYEHWRRVWSVYVSVSITRINWEFHDVALRHQILR